MFEPKFDSKSEEDFTLKYVEHQLKERHKPLLARELFKYPNNSQ